MSRLIQPGADGDDLRPDPDLGRAQRLLQRYAAATTDPEQRAVAERILGLVAAHPDALDRMCLPGHLTGSAFVVDHTGERALLLLHTKLGKWLQPGGHADGDGNLRHVAWREATEETGIDGLGIWSEPVDVDVHRIGEGSTRVGPRPGRAPGAHDHLDVRFLVVAPAGARAAGNHESRDLRWIERDDLATVTTEPGLLRLAAAAWSVFDGLDPVSSPGA